MISARSRDRQGWVVSLLVNTCRDLAELVVRGDDGIPAGYSHSATGSTKHVKNGVGSMRSGETAAPGVWISTLLEHVTRETRKSHHTTTSRHSVKAQPSRIAVSAGRAVCTPYCIVGDN